VETLGLSRRNWTLGAEQMLLHSKKLSKPEVGQRTSLFNLLREPGSGNLQMALPCHLLTLWSSKSQRINLALQVQYYLEVVSTLWLQNSSVHHFDEFL
jgi:hypothetical protein